MICARGRLRVDPRPAARTGWADRRAMVLFSPSWGQVRAAGPGRLDPGRSARRAAAGAAAQDPLGQRAGPMSEPTNPQASRVVLSRVGWIPPPAWPLRAAEGFAATRWRSRYGQRHSAELAGRTSASRSALGAVEHRQMNVDLAAFGGSALTDPSIAVPGIAGQRHPDDLRAGAQYPAPVAGAGLGRSARCAATSSSA